jgi:hypothetical protein
LWSGSGVYEKVLCWVPWSPTCTPWAPRTSTAYLPALAILVANWRSVTTVILEGLASVLFI